MLKISVLKVESPSCLWGRVVWGSYGETQTVEHYNNLQTQMNLFYHDVTRDLNRLKPTSVEKDKVYVVYWEAKKSWCRAVIESAIMDSVSWPTLCFLVDYGERIVVSLDKIRMAQPHFLQLPFWVKKFHLAGIKPTTLRVSAGEEKAVLQPSSQWDSSATLYLHSLLKVSTRTEAVLLEFGSDSTSMELYLTVSNDKICVNDDLVAKKFAYYIRDSTDSPDMDPGDRLPAMLSSNILTQTAFKSSNQQAAQSQQRLYCEDTGTSQSSDPLEASDWLMASSPPQSLLPELVSCDEDSKAAVRKEQMSSNSHNGMDCEAAESDSAEDADSSLAAALVENLNLFRFVKFLNPGRRYQHASSTESQNDELKDGGLKEVTEVSNNCTEPGWPNTSMSSETLHLQHGTENVLHEGLDEDAAPEEPSLNKSMESGRDPGEMWRTEEDWVCSRLMEWLNPEPLNPDPDAVEDVISPCNPWISGCLVHSTLPVETCNNMDGVPIEDFVLKVLKRRKYCTLSPAERFSWPAVARGYNTVVISHSAHEPLSYLAPFLTHMLLNSIFTSPSSSSGPIAVLLCSGWEKAQVVYDFLEETKVCQSLHPVMFLLGIGKDEAKAARIPKNCLLLVTTPFTLVRLLSCHCFQFLRLYHLVLDEADLLFGLAPDQMEIILQHFQKVTYTEEKASCPKQLIVIAKRWTNHMETLITAHMPHPYVVITVPEEAALYGDVQQVILMTLEGNKISGLMSALDFSPDVGQKTLIVANSVQEVEEVFKAVSKKSAFCLKTHEGLTHQFDFVMEQWRKNFGPRTHIILVTTNDCLKCLGIRDATCLVHYGFPSSPKVFGNRLFCMSQNFRNVCEQVCSQDLTGSCAQVTRSVLLISEKNARHVVGALRYLKRTNALIPPGLLSFVQRVHVTREEQKRDRPLCSYLKSFGVCRDSNVCPDRHRFDSQLDRSVLPASGVIEVVPVYIKSASVFYGHVIRKDDTSFDTMATEMASYYANQKPGAKELLEGGLYAVQEDQVFHRVKIISIADCGESLFSTLMVDFIDLGKQDEVRSHQILQLPEQFHSLPGRATEIIICRVKPADAELDWHPKVTRVISQKIQGVQHRARVVLTLGRTVFVDPLVRVIKVPGMKTFINEYNVQSEILNTGMGVANPEHLDLLRALCEEDLSNSSCTGSERLDEDLPCLEVRIKPEEEVLAEVMKALPHLSYEPLHPVASADQKTFQAADPEVTLLSDSEQNDTVEVMDSVTGGRDLCRTEPPEVSLDCLENGVSEGDDYSNTEHLPATKEAECSDSVKRFHPYVVWYQSLESVIVTVKLKNPESQHCDFYPDRVIYSGRVNGQLYWVNLELHQKIVADLCSWEMKSNEPVLKLVKQQQAYWEGLIRNKNIFVSYNMERVDEDQDKEPNGPWFVEETGEDNWYGDSESDSESD